MPPTGSESPVTHTSDHILSQPAPDARYAVIGFNVCPPWFLSSLVWPLSMAYASPTAQGCLGLAPLTVCSFLQQTFHISGSSLSLSLYWTFRLTHSLTCWPLTGSWQGLWSVTHSSLTFQVFFWNLGGSLCEHITLTFCMPENPEPCAWHQVWPLAWAVARSPCSSHWGSG